MKGFLGLLAFGFALALGAIGGTMAEREKWEVSARSVERLPIASRVQPIPTGWAVFDDTVRVELGGAVSLTIVRCYLERYGVAPSCVVIH